MATAAPPLPRLQPRICDINDFAAAKTPIAAQVPLHADATLFNAEPSRSSDSNDLLVGTLEDLSYSRLLLHFGDNIVDKSKYPGKTIDILCAEVGLAVRKDVNGPAIEMRRVTGPAWAGRSDLSSPSLELGATRPAQNGETTWKFRSYPSFEWGRAGGNIDFDSGEMYRENDDDKNGSTGGAYWYGGTKDFSELVQNWVDGNFPNYGVALVEQQEGVSEGYNLYKGRVSEDPPQLFIIYTVEGAVSPTAPMLPPVTAPTASSPVSSPTSPTTAGSTNNPSRGNNDQFSGGQLAMIIIFPIVVISIIVIAITMMHSRKTPTQTDEGNSAENLPVQSGMTT